MTLAGGDVQPGTLLKLGTSGVTGILLSHREPKSFALLYANDAGKGGAPAVGAAAAAAAGDAVEAGPIVYSHHSLSALTRHCFKTFTTQ